MAPNKNVSGESVIVPPKRNMAAAKPMEPEIKAPIVLDNALLNVYIKGLVPLINSASITPDLCALL